MSEAKVNRRRALMLGGAAAVLGGCAKPVPSTPAKPKPIQWRMVTSWPRTLRGPATAARLLAERVERASGGRMTVRIHPADTLVPAFDVFDAVSSGKAEMGHSAAHFWRGRSPAAPFFATLPFGLNAQEMNAWLYRGGGLALWRELYARFDLVPFPCGNLGVQMAGWFKKEIRGLRDLRGLKMRLPGLPGEVLKRLGGVPVDVRGDALQTAFREGQVDAAEWMSPYNDLTTDLRQSARFCYYPGWHEPGCTLELMINERAWSALPDELRAVVELAAQSVNEDLLALYTARNPRALDTLVNREQTEFRALPAEVLRGLKQASEQVVAELGASDEFSRRVYGSWLEFREQCRQWHRISERAFLEARD